MQVLKDEIIRLVGTMPNISVNEAETVANTVNKLAQTYSMIKHADKPEVEGK